MENVLARYPREYRKSFRILQTLFHFSPKSENLASH